MNLEFPLALVGHLFSVFGTETKNGTTLLQDTKAEHWHLKKIWSRKKVNDNVENMTENAILGGPSMQRNGVVVVEELQGCGMWDVWLDCCGW